MTARKDRIFILVSAIVVASLSYSLIKTLLAVFSEHIFTSAWHWGLVAVDIIAIVGMLWLIQNYRKRRRIEKETQGNSSSEESSD